MSTAKSREAYHARDIELTKAMEAGFVGPKNAFMLSNHPMPLLRTIALMPHNAGEMLRALDGYRKPEAA